MLNRVDLCYSKTKKILGYETIIRLEGFNLNLSIFYFLIDSMNILKLVLLTLRYSY